MNEVRVPGRVNLIGEWVDFNGGMVLPMALECSVVLKFVAPQPEQDAITSTSFDAAAAFALDTPAKGHWSDYVRGGLQFARAEGWISGGRSVEIESTIPAGAGLSSSAAVIVATLKALRPSPEVMDDVAVAHAARQIENEFIGVPCGIMDQMAVSVGTPGAALAFDTRSGAHRLIAIPDDWSFVVFHSGIQRQLADGRYKQRREECLAAAEALGLDYLCDAEMADLDQLPPELAARARHVASEHIRTCAAVDALERGDRAGFGQHMNDSHTSQSRDMQISTPKVDALVKSALSAGAIAVRQTGGGFGGCLVALLDPAATETWWSDLQQRHPGIWRVT